ncbi:hypothetical protein [Kineococcus sp. SYSU DK018]|uniref:hypothetical protein n=1 Tax=Kineococcus sp. SYSU DK018 TaxID=3383139 RepID=UPI003D7DABB6
MTGGRRRGLEEHVDVEVQHAQQGGARIAVHDTDDLGRLSARAAAAAPADAVDGALRDAGAGHLDAAGRHAWLRLTWLRAQGPDEPRWLEGFAAMIAHATAQGWTSEDGTLVRAHLERG